MSYRFHNEVELRWKDIDSTGVLNNAVYLTFLEQARYRYFRSLGLLRGESFPFLLGETCVRFLKPARSGMRIGVVARVEAIGNKSLEMSYEVRAGDLVLASALATLVWTDEELRSCPIPDEARTRIEAFEGRPLSSSSQPTSKLESP